MPIGADDTGPYQRRNRDRICRGAIATILAIGSVLGLSACAEAGPAPLGDPSPETGSSATPHPIPTEPEPEQELTVEALLIPAGLSAEEYGKTFSEERLSQWVMAGTDDPKLVEAYYEKTNEELLALYTSIAEKNAKIFADALFIPGWENHPDLVKTVEFYKERNKVNIDLYLATQSGTNGSVFKDWSTTESTETITESEESRELIIHSTEHNNAIENTTATKLSPAAVENNGKPYNPHIVTQVIDGQEYISTWFR